MIPPPLFNQISGAVLIQFCHSTQTFIILSSHN